MVTMADGDSGLERGVGTNQREALQGPVGADESFDEGIGRPRQQRLRRVVLDQRTIAQDGDAVADLQRLVDVVGDEDDGLLQRLQDLQQLVLQVLARDRKGSSISITGGSAASARATPMRCF
jgi:hypothetical protein